MCRDVGASALVVGVFQHQYCLTKCRLKAAGQSRSLPIGATRSMTRAVIWVAPCSMRTLAAIAQKLPELPADAKVLGFNYDTGERYLSVEGFLPA